MPCRVATENIKGICYYLEKENKQTNKNESKKCRTLKYFSNNCVCNTGNLG